MRTICLLPSLRAPGAGHVRGRFLAGGSAVPVSRLTGLAGGRAGFTLIEIMVVVIILGLLAVLVAPNVIDKLSVAKGKTARTQIELLGTALDSYRLDNGTYPTTQQGMSALWTKPVSAPEPRNWSGPYLKKAVPQDPWGNAYVYRSPGESNPDGYDLISLGADGSPGGEGENADIKSWE